MLTVARKRRACAFARDDGGVSAIEFSLCAPVMIVLLLVGVDTARFVIATKRVESVAATIGQMMSVNTSGSLSDTDLQFYRDSAMVIFPQVLADAAQQNVPWTSDIGVTMSSVAFTGTSPNVTAKVTWSGGSAPRSCTVPPVAAADAASPSPTTLPPDGFTPGSLLVVDVKFTFRPTIAPHFMSPMSISRSFYMAPRFVQSVAFGGSTFAKTC